jgi:alpha-galactosidase
VQGTAEMLARWIDKPMSEITYTCAGINHMAWYLKYEWNGEDAYPLIREAITSRPEVYNEEIVRNEMFLNFDYYVTESSGHNSEYNWWFRKRPDLIEKYCVHGTGWNPGVHAYLVDRVLEQNKTWREDTQAWLNSPEPISLERGSEFAAYIINALLGGEPFEFYGNVPNTSLISNLPQNACVEVPVWASRKGFSPVHVGALPPQVAILDQVSSSVEEMAVEGCLTGNPRLIFQAIANDPLSAAVCSLDEIKQMVNLMFEQNRQYLPQFKHFHVD